MKIIWKPFSHLSPLTSLTILTSLTSRQFQHLFGTRKKTCGFARVSFVSHVPHIHDIGGESFLTSARVVLAQWPIRHLNPIPSCFPLYNCKSAMRCHSDLILAIEGNLHTRLAADIVSTRQQPGSRLSSDETKVADTI